MALSVKTREHIRRWAALAGPKWGALLGGAAALAAAITFTGSALHFTTVADTHGDTVRILTAATDLAAVLQQSGTPPLGEHDEAVWSQTEDGLKYDAVLLMIKILLKEHIAGGHYQKHGRNGFEFYITCKNR